MKKLISLFVAALLLVVAVVPFALSASAEAAPFHVTHYNDSSAEGACVVFTESYSGGGWWCHIAFSPVEGKENTYEIVEIVNGLPDGSASALSIPEGGFVYALNSGNNWGDLTQAAIDAGTLESQWWYANYQQNEEYYTTNFQNASTNAMITTIGGWSVGDMFVINGLDLENLTMPTSTPDLKWYEEGYTCTATYDLAVDGDLLPSESEPADDSSAPADDKSEPADESVPANDASAPAANNSGSAEEPASNNTWIFVAAAVAAVVVVVVVVLVVTKKKK